MHLYEEELRVRAAPGHHNMLGHIAEQVETYMRRKSAIPIRLVVTESDGDWYHCEIGAISGDLPKGCKYPESILQFIPRRIASHDHFNVVHLVPTGIGSEIGGHAGDATPTAKLLASVCDTLITHPNVLNGSDVIDIPANSLYVEGSVICRLLMGTVGLQPTRANSLLVLMDAHEVPLFNNAVVNSVSAARASYGLRAEVLKLEPKMRMAWRRASSGRAAGKVDSLEPLLHALDEHAKRFDAVAITSVIDVPQNFHDDYFRLEGAMINPWGGVEALLTHATSLLYNLPSAHSPMFESEKLANADPGVVDPRMAAEAVSLTFLQCILKGLQRSPRIITDHELLHHPSVLTSDDISCVVIPDGCVGLPTLAALEQRIPVIAVRENQNVMQNDLRAMQWLPGQLYTVDNYWEAAGVIAALKAGLAPEAVRRPLSRTVPISTVTDDSIDSQSTADRATQEATS